MCNQIWLEKPDYGERFWEPQALNCHKNGWQQYELMKGLPVTEGTTSWRKGNLKVLYSPKELHTETDLGGGYWKHLSISHSRRYPFWDEIIDARYNFFNEDETVIQIMPPKREYVNFHSNCFHLWCRIKEA